MDGWVDVEPEFLEGKGGRGVESMLELAKESLVVLRGVKISSNV